MVKASTNFGFKLCLRSSMMRPELLNAASDKTIETRIKYISVILGNIGDMFSCCLHYISKLRSSWSWRRIEERCIAWSCCVQMSLERLVDMVTILETNSHFVQNTTFHYTIFYLFRRFGVESAREELEIVLALTLECY